MGRQVLTPLEEGLTEALGTETNGKGLPQGFFRNGQHQVNPWRWESECGRLCCVCVMSKGSQATKWANKASVGIYPVCGINGMRSRM